MDRTQLLDQTIQILKPAAAVGQAIGVKVAASALWDWMKEKFKRRSAAAAEAVEKVQECADNEANWEMLRAELGKALAEDEGLCKELIELLAKHGQVITQQANVSGSANVVVQNFGNGKINVQQ